MVISVFSSMEDMLDQMAKDKEQADAQVQPFQAAMKPGDYFIRYVPSCSAVIFGEVLDPFAECEKELRNATTDDMREELQAELDYEKEMRAESPHYRFTRAFSTDCTEGEIGDTHASVMLPITRTVFESGRRLGWVITNINDSPDNLEYRNVIDRLFRGYGN